MVKIAILGYGTIGSGVGQVLRENAALVEKRAGTPIEAKYILDLRDFLGDPEESKVVHDIDVILDDPEVRIVVECMGGLHPAYEYVRRCLEHRKSVVTSNKELVAAYGGELLDFAHRNELNYQFEASVGGGIPVIRAINSALTAENLEAVTGILNGTTNYILTRMKNEGLSYEEVLKDAQALGYAERDPSADVLGHDAGRKLSILSSLAFDVTVKYEDIRCEGITKVSQEDIRYATELGMAIKLLAKSRRVGQEVFARVGPSMVGPDHLLYNVTDVFNGILIRGNMVGDILLVGKGAGSLPTASAVVADVIDEAKHLHRSVWGDWKDERVHLADFEDLSCRFFVRLAGDLTQARREEAEEVFKAERFVTIPGLEEFGFVTAPIRGRDLHALIDSRKDVLSRYRIDEA
ncbi:MAG: homoserine dehydrogenase [Lachnospiraceae bacterium]|nr:homoserine dehydrogenase [Lachnospiraceae bacterium]